MILGKDVDALLSDMGATWRSLVYDSHLRWLGPEKGVMHMAIGAVVNALWDLKCKRAGLPLWRLLAQMTPEELVDLVDFRYLTDALTRDEALAILRAGLDGRERREADLLRDGYPAYTTTPGWLGYDDAKLERLCREAVADGFTQIKLKVGANVDDDIRSARDRAGGGRARHRHCHRREPALGCRRQRSSGSPSCRATISPGWRSRPARTTSSAMPRSPVRSARYRWQRENMSPTG